MKVNFSTVQSTYNQADPNEVLDLHATHLSRPGWSAKGTFRNEPELPEGFEHYCCVDVLGEEFVWMNNTFPKEKFKWYLWFESVFLVPPEMATFLRLRWS